MLTSADPQGALHYLQLAASLGHPRARKEIIRLKLQLGSSVSNQDTTDVSSVAVKTLKDLSSTMTTTNSLAPGF